MSRGGRGGGAGGVVGSDQTGVEVIPGLDEDGDNNEVPIQDALDDAPEGTVLVVPPGDYTISYPIRIISEKGLRGAGDRGTIIRKLPEWYAGPSIITGPLQNAAEHAAAIMDDADFSYAVNTAPPYNWFPVGLYGLYPVEWGEFWFEWAISIPEVDGDQFFSIHGRHDNADATTWQMQFIWAADQQRLRFLVKIGGGTYDLHTTTTFHTPLDERHMIALGYDGSTLRLFVDGVIEATATPGGTFTSNPWEIAVIGGAWTKFGQSSYQDAATFHLGHFYAGTANKHTANYTVDWGVPAQDADCELQLVCQDAHESDDLIRLRVKSNGYGWMQTRRAPTDTGFGAGATVTDMGFSGGVNGFGYSIEVWATIRTKVRDIYSEETAIHCYGNSYYSEFSNISQVNGHRFGSLISGGLLVLGGLLKFSGAPIGLALINGNAVSDVIHIYDYSHIGATLDTFGGTFGTFATSDEGAVDTSPSYGILIGGGGVTEHGYLTINGISVDIFTSDTTIPVGVWSNNGGNMTLVGQFPYTAGLTTPPAELIKLPSPLHVDPINVNITAQSDVPLSLHPQKFISPSGPVGAVTLGDASAFITARQGREFNFSGTVLTDNRVISLHNEMTTDLPVHDGTIIEVICNPTFGGFTLTVENHDGADLHVFSAAGQRRFRFSRATGNWSRMEAA
jgi:hypothetical protein